MTINYYIKEVYGNANMYFANAKQQSAWQEMSGRKTHTLNDQDMLQRFAGERIEFVQVFGAEV